MEYERKIKEVAARLENTWFEIEYTEDLWLLMAKAALALDGILIKSDDQNLPPSLAKDVLVKTLMLKSDSEGRHWVKVEPKRK